jgi:hypothetical protein
VTARWADGTGGTVARLQETERSVAPRRDIAYIDQLSDRDEFLRVRISTVAGDVVAFTVQYETVIQGRRLTIVRYDSQHGTPHRDTLNRAGEVVSKRWISLPLNDAVQFAIDDLRENWERYKVAFEGTEA